MLLGKFRAASNREIASPYELMSNVNIKVDRVVNAIPTIHQNHMSPDNDVTVAARWTAQTAYHVIRCRATHPPHISIEHVARLKPTLVIVIPSVCCLNTGWSRCWL